MVAPDKQTAAPSCRTKSRPRLHAPPRVLCILSYPRADCIRARFVSPRPRARERVRCILALSASALFSLLRVRPRRQSSPSRCRRRRRFGSRCPLRRQCPLRSGAGLRDHDPHRGLRPGTGMCAGGGALPGRRRRSAAGAAGRTAPGTARAERAQGGQADGATSAAQRRGVRCVASLRMPRRCVRHAAARSVWTEQQSIRRKCGGNRSCEKEEVAGARPPRTRYIEWLRCSCWR